MADFKPGDKVLIDVVVAETDSPTDRQMFVRLHPDGYHFWIERSRVHPAPEPPYVEPELAGKP